MNRIKSIRTYFGMSQTAFAEKFGVDQTAVSNWEKGKNSIDVKIVEKISQHFSIPMDYIYGATFEITRPKANWHKSELEDYATAPTEIKDFLLFKYGRGVFHAQNDENPTDEGELTEHEAKVLNAYRNQPEMQIAVDRLLGIYNDEYVHLYTAASSKDNRPDEIIKISKEKWEKIKNTPDTDDTLM